MFRTASISICAVNEFSWGFETVSSRQTIGDAGRNSTELLGHTLAIVGIIIWAIIPSGFNLFIISDITIDFLFSSSILSVLSYLAYLGPVFFVLGILLVQRIRTRDPNQASTTPLPTYGGALLILGGVWILLRYSFFWLRSALDNALTDYDIHWMILELALTAVVFAAGILALKRRQWTLVLIACSATLLTASMYGVLAIIPIALSRSEFTRE